MKNIALRLMYDGSSYHGWQAQKDLPTVSQSVEKAIYETTGETVRVTGCGRTDAGVHALRYCANFRSDCKIPLENLPLAINSRLPEDISVTDAVFESDGFNAIGSCVKKEYVYLILNERVRVPFLNKRACFYPRPLDFGLLEEACAAFVGKHDFAAVRSAGSATKTTVREVFWCRAVRSGGLIAVSVCADGFLYNMARTIVGTALYCSQGKIAPGDIPDLLQTRDRRLAGPTMPPEGLYLNRIWYEGAAGKMMARNSGFFAEGFFPGSEPVFAAESGQ